MANTLYCDLLCDRPCHIARVRRSPDPSKDITEISSRLDKRNTSTKLIAHQRHLARTLEQPRQKLPGARRPQPRERCPAHDTPHAGPAHANMSALLAAALAWPPPSAPEQRAQRWPPAGSAAGGRGKLAWPLAPALFSACRAARARGRRCGVGGAPRCLCAVCPGAPLQRCCCHCFGYLPRCAPPMPCRCRCRWRAGTKKGSTCKAGDIWDGVATCAARVSRSVGQGSGGRPERPIPCHCDCPYLYIPASIATQTSSALFPLPLAV